MRPAVFADLDFTAARERASAERKILVVDATAAWCGPCKMMDRTTWVEPSIVAWLEQHAVAIQLDVDAQKDIARQLQIQAMPTIIAFVDGKEFDRAVGAKRPKELLAWLDGVTHGETSLVVHKPRERRGKGEGAEMMARLERARDLVETGRYDEALTETVWLWEHMLEHEPATYAVRLSAVAMQLGTLATAHPPARAAVAALRDRTAPPAAGPLEVEMFRDWTCLNGALGEKDRTLAWYDALPVRTRARLGLLLEHEIIPLLIEAGRWADAGALYDGPITTIELLADLLAHLKNEGDTDTVGYLREQLRTNAAQIVRALLAAGRTAEADTFEARVRELDPSAEMATGLANARHPLPA